VCVCVCDYLIVKNVMFHIRNVLGQLSLAVHRWVDTMSTSKSWGVSTRQAHSVIHHACIRGLAV